ncbi:type II secretion system protein GspL [Pseudemcibacter aquimaris]|uniref:type II secretion system protein GspL n=1 Tax=Pseudemcibacter aquimaris TaxID=2857064 RepID=UPI0020114E90|nr:type II secretion system protein GspL [Pseudemcibacter aquimaris]MCC3861755.1 type II secretion system protein GspL [Pseudemcibacter aquimaris]WDU58524.1 hypothetical protein KW060_15135 [Pseudemcibacter aquimaris]
MSEIKFQINQENKETIAILPGEWVSFFVLELPDFSENKLDKILPGLLSDLVAGSIEDNHIAVVDKNSNGHSLVAVCHKERLNEARSLAERDGLILNAIWPEYAFIAVPDEDIHIVQSDDNAKVSARRKDGTGFTVPMDMLELVTGDAHTIQSSFGRVPKGAGLATGEYSPRPPIKEYFKITSRLAALVATVFIFWIMWIWMATSSFEEERTRYADASIEVFKKTYPTVTRIVNVEAQMRSLSQGGSGSNQAGFLSLSDMVFNAISNAPGTKLENLSYDQDGNQERVDITISSMNFSEAGLFEANLKTAGFTVEQGGSSQDGEMIYSTYSLMKVAP